MSDTSPATDAQPDEPDQDAEPPLSTPPQAQAPADADVDDQDAEPTQNVPDAEGPSGHS